MNRFTTGIILGSVLGMVGVQYTMHNPSAKRKIMKNSKKAINKAGNIMEDVSSDIW